MSNPAKKPAPCPRRVLLTAFQPFGQWTENTSLAIMRKADGLTAENVLGLELPVEFDRAASLLLETAERERPAEILALGMAGGRREVCIETIAFNEDRASLPDNAGALRDAGSLIDPDGPERVTPRFPREELVAFLSERGFPSRLSDDAGRYVCNNLFYRVARAIAPGVAFTFVHVPGPEDWPATEIERLGEALAAWANRWQK
jgi:pyroglutamyl-peptidase